jgi:hypothetical protein
LSEGSSIPIAESDKKLFITNSLRLSPLQILVLKVMAETAFNEIKKEGNYSDFSFKDLNGNLTKV